MTNSSIEDLVSKVSQKLQNHPQLAPYALKTRVYADGTVQIQGIVDVLEEKLQAEELLWNIPGVKKIENDITVCTDGGINDFDVAFEVAEEFQANPEVPPTVGVKVNGGEVQLIGHVSNYSEAQEALETAAKARGVKEVISRLRLSVNADDASLNNRVQAAFMAEADLIPGRIKSIAHHGVVTLFGKIPENQAFLVLETVMKVPGVKHIKNLINQEPADIDDQIAIRFVEQIAANPYLSHLPISIEVVQGRVIVSGTVDNLKAKKDIEEILHRLPVQFKQDIHHIDNQLRLEEQLHHS
jgi:Predicted periplasmic or secreted lipoprotein